MGGAISEGILLRPVGAYPSHDLCPYDLGCRTEYGKPLLQSCHLVYDRDVMYGSGGCPRNVHIVYGGLEYENGCRTEGRVAL